MANKDKIQYLLNLLADAMVPYLVSNGIQYVRNTPDMTAASSIRQGRSTQCMQSLLSFAWGCRAFCLFEPVHFRAKEAVPGRRNCPLPCRPPRTG